MNENQLAHFRKLLQLELDQIVDGINGQNTEKRGILEIARGDAIDATTDGTGLVLEKIGQDEKNLIRKIKLAIQRIDDGTYGTCAVCGMQIPMNRLKAKPSVSLCYHCQEQKENMA